METVESAILSQALCGCGVRISLEAHEDVAVIFEKKKLNN